MEIPAPIPDKKRKLSSDTEGRESKDGAIKLAKLEPIEQASDPEIPKEETHVGPTLSGPTMPTSVMEGLKDMTKKLSPSKAAMHGEEVKATSQVPELTPQVMHDTLGGIQSMLGKLLKRSGACRK